MVQIRAPSGGGARAGATVRKGGSRVSFTPHPTTTRSRNGGMTSFLERPIPRAPLKVCRSHLSRLASALPSRTATGRRSAWASPADYVPVGSSGKRPASPRPRPDRGTGRIRCSRKTVRAGMSTSFRAAVPPAWISRLHPVSFSWSVPTAPTAPKTTSPNSTLSEHRLILDRHDKEGSSLMVQASR